MQLYGLTVEHKVDPVGVDAQNPRFSWKIKSNKRGAVQSAYQIKAWSQALALWNSGVVETSDSQNIRYEGVDLSSRQEIFWSVKVWVTDENGCEECEESAVCRFVMGLLNPEDWTGRWIEPPEDTDPERYKPAWYVRKEFQVAPELKRAYIYQSAHGLYDFYINGACGTKDRFLPGLSSYYYRIQYQMYDITDLLHTGNNCLAVRLADGWWRGVTGGTVRNNFGFRLAYLGQIELEYADGHREIIGSDESFTARTGGLLVSDMTVGDIYNANLEPERWMLSGFADDGWETMLPATEATDGKRIASAGVPVREKEVFIPKEFIDENGCRILDFGQNIAGYVRMRLHHTKPDQTVILLHGEDIKDGCFSQDNIKDTPLSIPDFQKVTYICKGADEEAYCPAFSVFGFRYVKLEGYEEPLQEGDFEAVAVYSDMADTGDFTCSNPLIDQLVKNARWSQKGNYLDVAVDCPTRERNAWTGDAQIYTKTAAWFMDVYAFYEKWMQDQAIEQYASGKVGITFPSTSSVHHPESLLAMKRINPTSELAGPTGNGNIGEDCAGWGDSAAWIPYMLYLCYGDQQILENQYSTAKKWADYMLTCAKDHNPIYEDQPQYHTYDADGELEADYIYDTRMHYGEWQEPIPKAPEGNSLEEIFARWIREGKPLVATAYMCRSVSNVAHMAQITGRRNDYEKYSHIAQKIRKVYEKYLIADDGTIEPGHQAAYVRALAMDLCTGEKREKVIGQLIHEIEANDHKLNTGFLSTPFLLPVLVDCGYTETAYKLLEQTECPSWLHPILLGATTIPESWVGLDAHVASFNHYSFGAVCDFLFGYAAGIRPVFEAPGYKEFILHPVLGGSLTWAKAAYESVYGTIVSEWERSSGCWQYHCEIPVNTRARLTLPDGREMWLGSGKYDFEGGYKL